MKIIALHVHSFGKLKNVDLQFQSGVNVLQQANSHGKTTMAGFIRAMLYGFTYTRNKGVTDAVHFAPWGSTEKFGGSMVVEHEGAHYRIERFFGATARQETLNITNEKTGSPLNWQKQPGEMLLGLTAESYDRSAYYPQEGVELATNENLDSRLANLVQDGAEDYDKVQERLRAYKKNLRYERGMGGEIYELECKKRQLEEQLHKTQSAERRADEIDKRLSDIAQERAALALRHSEYSQQLTKLQRTVAQAQPTDDEKRIKTHLAELDEKLSRISSEFDEDFQHCDNLAREIAEIKEEKTEKKQHKLVLAVAAAFIFVGIVLSVLSLMHTVSGSLVYAVGIPFVVVGIGAIVAEYAVDRKFRRALLDIENKKKNLATQYIQIASKYVFTDGVDYETVKRTLWERFRDYQGDVRERNTLLSVSSKAQATDTAEIEQDIQNVNNVLSALTQQMSELATETGRLFEERKGLVFNSVEIMDQLLTVEEQHKEALHRYEVADTVVKLLEQAKDNLSSSYLPRLCARCSQLLQEITQSDFSVAVDRNFTVSIRENGQTKSMSEFSRGIREITLLCFRIALSELLYDGAIPFVIVDDEFVNFDEDNFVRATTLLKRLSTHAQVVYFTCHDRMGTLLK